MSRPHFDRWHVIPLLLCLFAFAMALVISRTVFERLPHLEDEYAYLFQARTLARGDLVIESPQPRRAYWQPFVVDRDDVRFGKYTPGWALILAGGTIAAGEGREWIVNALIAAVTVALVYRIGADCFGRTAGTVAAALTAFSPMALLLNATMMGHTAALCAGCAALLAYLRLERRLTRRRTTALALACGIALGLLTANRPITGIAFALPLVVRALTQIRLTRAYWSAHLTIAGAALIVVAMVPLYNLAAVGEATANLYTEVWEYDCIGFEGCGRSGHTLERAFRHTRFDLSLTAVDLFGWGFPFGLTDAARQHLTQESDFYPIVGFSMILLPFGLAIGMRRRAVWAGIWAVGLIAMLALPQFVPGGAFWLIDPRFAWGWVIAAIGWTLLPLLPLRGDGDRRAAWTWLLACTALLLVGLQLTYWIGSQRYSTRYYYEGLAAAALLSAIPIAWAIGRLRGVGRAALAVGFVGLLIAVLLSYTLPRIDTLRGYNRITRAQIEAVDARRAGAPALVIITGEDVRWRAYGALMALTSPYLDGPIVAALDYSNGTNPEVRAAILARFPDRVVIDMAGAVNDVAFVE